MDDFKLGTYTKPVVKHDHGFLDDGNGNIDYSKKRTPNAEDLWEYAKWIAKLEAVEAIRFDLMDACAAYRHFLLGNGESRKIHYRGFLENDSSGKEVLQNLHRIVRKYAMKYSLPMLDNAPTDASQTCSFQMYSGIIPVGSKMRPLFPYPTTENWQKAIGAHFIYGKVDVHAKIKEKKTVVDFILDITMYVEDMYNFNPHNNDIKTGTPDEANGRFELTGLAKEYLNEAQFKTKYSFDVPYDDLSTPTIATINNEQISNER